MADHILRPISDEKAEWTELPTGAAYTTLNESIVRPDEPEVVNNKGFAVQGEFDQQPDLTIQNDLDDMASAGAGWVRINVGWSAIQPVSEAQAINWTRIDWMVNQVQSRGMKVLACLLYTPEWAAAPGGQGGVNYYKDAPVASKYGLFCIRAVAHLKTLGVKHYELWNEPNLSGFWYPRNAANYTAAVKAAYPGMKFVDPECTVVTGGLSPAATDANAINPVEFFDAMYAAGLHGYFDAVGMHPYTQPSIAGGGEVWNPWTQMVTMHDTMVEEGDGDKAIWATECGAPTDGDPAVPGTFTTETIQANIVESIFAVGRLLDWFGPAFIFMHRDKTDQPGSSTHTWQDFFGLRYLDRSPKPALAKFTAANGDYRPSKYIFTSTTTKTSLHPLEPYFLPDDENVVGFTLWAYCKVTAGDAIMIGVDKPGEALVAQLSATNTDWEWRGVTVDASDLTPEDLQDLKARMTSNFSGAGTAYVKALYAVLSTETIDPGDPELPTALSDKIMSLVPELYWKLYQLSSPVLDYSGNDHQGFFVGDVRKGEPGLVPGSARSVRLFNPVVGGEATGVCGIEAEEYDPYVPGSQRTFHAIIRKDSHYGAPTTFAGAGLSAGIGTHPTWEFIGYNIIRFYSEVNTFPVGWDDIEIEAPVGQTIAFVVSYDDATGISKYYVNGILIGSLGPTATGGGMWPPGDPANRDFAYNATEPSGPFTFGYRGDGSAFETFDGGVDEIAVFERILTDKEVRQLAQAAGLYSRKSRGAGTNQQEWGERSTTKLLQTEAADRVRKLGLRTRPPLTSEWQCRSLVRGHVLIVGDSHTWLSGCGSAYRKQDVDCLPGRTSPMGADIVAGLLRGRHDKVCFHLSTNDWSDPEAQDEALHRVWDLIGKNRKLILVNSFREGTGSDEVNQVVADFAAGHPNRCTVVDWAAYAEANDIIPVDTVHFDGPGYVAMVEQVKAGIAAA